VEQANILSDMRKTSLCEIIDIDKSFYNTRVLHGVSMTVERGDVVGLAGENGAGKSTLMKIIAGTYMPDGGKISVEGKNIPFGHPLMIQKMGVSVIYQEFSLIPQLTVAENLQMRHSSEKKQLRPVKWKEIFSDSERLLTELGATRINPRSLVQDLSVANKQIVEIAKALTVHPRLLLMDEPSATLNAQETEDMFRIVEKLRDDGVGIIYITHRLEEMFEICNRLVVMKDGEITQQCAFAGVEKKDIINWMVGREMSVFFGKREKKTEEEHCMLEVEGLSSDAGIHGVNLRLKRGETLGIAGLNGSGRSEMIRAVCGLDNARAAKLEVDGKRVSLKNVREAMRAGIAYLPEERKSQGMIPAMSVKENMSYAAIKQFSKGWLISRSKENQSCERLIQSLDIKCQSKDQSMKHLSGGNQQKVIIGKWMLTQPRIYLMDEPTRGIDVGAKHEIYALINRLTAEGAAVVFVSSELPELIGVSDRILVMANGTVSGELKREEASEEAVMHMAFVAKKKEGGPPS
jgi:ribose transport system ATP-binding protein